MNDTRILIEKDVPDPMRDGVITYGDVYRPAHGHAVPAIVSRTPYSKEGISSMPRLTMPVPKLAERGYAVLVADCRGRFRSEGSFTPFLNEGLDGYDTVEWAASQPWCNGSVGIVGMSYLGVTALSAARERAPALRCAVALITPDDYYDGWVYLGGALQLAFIHGWGQAVASNFRAPRDTGNLMDRPLADIPGAAEPFWSDWLAHDSRDEYWESVRHSRDYSRFTVPTLHVSGWFDIFGGGAVRNFVGMQAAGVPSQHLWMGPWAHATYERWLGEMDFGASGAATTSGLPSAYYRFLDSHLLGKEASLPPVRYFLMGANEWRSADSWPPSEGRAHRLYLHSRGSANTASGDGELTEAPPDTSEQADRYLYDPERPVPTTGGSIIQFSPLGPGPQDQGRVERREDVLCYTTTPLQQPLVIAGPVGAELWAVTDAPDTDWTAKLVDVHPDGQAISLCDGIIRARFRESLVRPELVEPGTPHCYTIDLANIAHRFAAGHRVRLEISSSNFPRIDRNHNTGTTVAHETMSRPAIQQVLHDANHASLMNLWVLPE